MVILLYGLLILIWWKRGNILYLEIISIIFTLFFSMELKVCSSVLCGLFGVLRDNLLHNYKVTNYIMPISKVDLTPP